MLNKKALAASVSAGPAEFVEDVFSTYLYTGNGSTQTITNNVDLSGEGGLVWIKSRSAATDHQLFDTERGATKELISNSTAAEATDADTLTAFNADGFSLGADSNTNTNAATYASFTFRKAKKFFDVVTYTGDSVSGRQIPHNLGSVPGMVIVKITSSGYVTGWFVWHRSFSSNNNYLQLNSSAAVGSFNLWNNTAPTSTHFTVSNDSGVNIVGETYVAYLFAHDAGGFGDAGTDNIISCGSFSTDGSGLFSPVNIGFEPQWILFKKSNDAQNWVLFDTMRGFSLTSQNLFNPNLSDAESVLADKYVYPTATGFAGDVSLFGGNSTVVYMAIRRPMKTPTTGTEVYTPTARTGTGATVSLTNAGFAPDLLISKERSNENSRYPYWSDRLRGPNRNLYSNDSGAEYDSSVASNTVLSFDQTGVTFGADSTLAGFNANGESYSQHYFKRATGFFDIVCYTGTSSTNQRIAHNLGVVPELIIHRRRTTATEWFTYVSSQGRSKYLELQATNAVATSTNIWGTSDPTTTDFGWNASGTSWNGNACVAYLFASLAGVSKVGSYTGNGSNQTINCGFTNGARFVLIKRTDSTSAWFLFDTARGIVSGNDPYLRLNQVDGDVTSNDPIDPDNSGFIVNQNTTSNLNVNGASYIFLAIS